MNKRQSTAATVKFLGFIPAAALALYSLALFFFELGTSQEAVRPFFSDIGHAYQQGYYADADGFIGYGINTSLSASLLAGAGLLLLFACFTGDRQRTDQIRLYAAQALIFFYMALDDRLMLHERFADLVGWPSSLPVVAVAAVNGLIYLLWFRGSYITRQMALSFFIGAALFVVMMSLDELVPHDLPGRLSVEDLCKVWAGYCFLRFAWLGGLFRQSPTTHQTFADWLAPALGKPLPAWLRSRLLT